jgi:hypothetical protein
MIKSRNSLKLRMIADFVLVCAFGLAVPPILAPLGRSWGVLLESFATFLLAVGFLFDGLRTRLRLLRLSSDALVTKR